MNEEIARQVFFELHSDLPREGPGDNDSTAKVFSLLPEVPLQPAMLDVGCGPGMQTLQLARLTKGPITAVDMHEPYLDQLKAALKEAQLSDRVTPMQADMQDLPFAAESFDVIWSEGAAYIMGFGRALRNWRSLLTPKGSLVISEITWIRSDAPNPVVKFWQNEYPHMQGVEENIRLLTTMGYRSIAHFLLPADAWWTHYYTPLEQRINRLRSHYADNPDALQVLESHQEEMDLFRRYSDYYGYVFYVGQIDNRL